jgi:RNA polymerase sigma-70 factor (ECF subfamily)
MESKLLLLVGANFDALNSTTQKEIYKEYYKFAYSPIIYMMKDHAAVEDIIQISFLKVINSKPEIDSESRLKGWIKVVIKNTVFNYFRKNKKKRNEIELDSVYINDSTDYATVVGSIESEIELKIMTETIGKCLKYLKPEYQALIELRWKQELSYKEIAEQLDTSEDTVKYKLHRAREAIKKIFKKEWGDDDEKR